jgi:hypothetical protein
MVKNRSASAGSHKARVIPFTGGGLHTTYMAKCKCGWSQSTGRDSLSASLAASRHNR